MPRSVSAVRPLARIAVGACVGLLALTGCGAGEPRSIGPAGVDGLEIPTPTPRAADFVRTIDNRWFPLAEGSQWRYESDDVSSATVEVTGRRQEIAGVTTTEVATTVEGSRRDVTTLRYYAQDRDGNVWFFGEEVEGAGDWRAGVDGARAGLVMPARPRVGDGFVQEDAPGVAEDRAELSDIAASASTPAGSWSDAVEISQTTPLDPTSGSTRYYAPGVGLVRIESNDGVLEELVSFSVG